MSLLLRSSEKTSRLDFVHPWRLTGLSFIWWSGLNITTIEYRQRHPAGFRSRSQSRASVGFTWEGFDEMDEVSGDGSAELLDDGSIEIEFAYHNGDEAVLKAKLRYFFNSLQRPLELCS